MPSAQHPLKAVPGSHLVQRKFCTVLVAKTVRRPSNGGTGNPSAPLPPEPLLNRAYAEFDLAAAEHRVSKIFQSGR